ncbi:NTP transferase domain-containing protein, partial [Candidatus Woesearchaeota archaeon]|nr:NTP transferase domain-containing protein [Candidatus Woesearchaeota archaeon]
MKAIILNSGIGKRLQPLTNSVPKCLLEINGKTVIQTQLENLIRCEVTDILITTGPFEEKIRDYVKNRFPNIKVTYVNNPQYNSTNYIYSLWLTRDNVTDDILLIHGDLVFDNSLLERIIKQKK